MWKIPKTLTTRIKCRSSHRRCSIKENILKIFPKFTEKHLGPRPFFNKVEGFIKKETLLLQLYLKRDSGAGVFL